MSWDSYRDSLVGTGCVDKAAVCGVEDGGVWTQSQGFNVSHYQTVCLELNHERRCPIITCRLC